MGDTKNQQAMELQEAIEYYSHVKDRRIQALITAATSSTRSEVPEWLPIESAPRDGTKVLLYGSTPHSIVMRQSIGSYEVGGYTEGWVDANGAIFYAHYWQPLPQPPKSTTQAERDENA